MGRRLLVCLAAALCLCGCEERMLLDYRDDPYLAEYAGLDEAALALHLRSIYLDDRKLALRVLAQKSAEARLAGDAAAADRMVERIVEAYEADKNQDVRACVVALCAPVCGKGSERMLIFLRRRIAEGAWTEQAALALAASEGGRAASELLPLLHHPKPEVRYAGAVALTVCGDPSGRAPVAELLASMTPGAAWPYRLNGQSLREARRSLEARAERCFASVQAAPAAGSPSPVEVPGSD